jgi:hypothetical protein
MIVRICGFASRGSHLMPPTAHTPPPPVSMVDAPAVVIDQVTHGYVLLDDAVTAFADGDRIAGLALLIGARTSLASDTVERALDARSPGAATLLCRAAGVGVNGFSAVLRMRQRRLRDEDLNPAHALAGFLQTPTDVAQGAVGMMQANGGPDRSPPKSDNGAAPRKPLY